MFPAVLPWWEAVTCFPRVRGDVPQIEDTIAAARRFSPRARGCSFSGITVGLVGVVFPACAGMFPRRRNILHVTPGFPRVRGDVPQPAPTLERVKVFSPRARGCSYFLSRGRALDGVFPAYAGMFLAQASWLYVGNIFPEVIISNMEAYSAAGEMGFGWWLVEHYLPYHIDCPNSCGLGGVYKGWIGSARFSDELWIARPHTGSG